METSSPIATPNNNNRRRTLIQIVQDQEPTPVRRRSLIVTPIQALDAPEKSSDDIERLQRRNLVEMQRRVSNIPGASPLNDSTKFLGEQDMRTHLQICSKLFTENKINAKNAWKLHIIDLLRDLSQKSAPDTLQVASTSLDISAKVYGIRVDDLHAAGLKLASQMARTAEKTNEDNEDAEANDEQEVGDTSKTKKSPKKKKKRNFQCNKVTVAKDPKCLKETIPKLESVFFSTRINAEASAIDNLFTNTLKMDHSGCHFKLLSKEPAFVTKPDPVLKNMNKDDRKKYPLSVSPFAVKLCAPFQDFYVNKWDPDEEEKLMAADKSLQSQNQVVFDENGIPIPELDGSIHDIFADQGNDDIVEAPLEEIDEDVFEERPQHRGGIEHIVDFRPNETGNLQKSEYSYNSIISTTSGKVIDQIWAGPSHWKLKFIRRSSARYSGQVVEKTAPKQTRKKVEPELINFLAEIPESELKMKIKIKKKPATLDINKILLPVPDKSCLELISNIGNLMSKPGIRPFKKGQRGTDVEYDVSEYRYDNPMDSQYCPNVINNNNDDDGHSVMNDDGPVDNDFDEEEIVHQAPENFLGGNLIDAPEAIPQSYVPYALHPKKMDMKKLKAAIWQVLTNTVVEKDVMTDRDGTVNPTTFSKVYMSLPPLLSENMKRDLSRPLTLVALLHLCNEQGLMLNQHPDLKDFDVLGPSQTVC